MRMAPLFDAERFASQYGTQTAQATFSFPLIAEEGDWQIQCATTDARRCTVSTALFPVTAVTRRTPLPTCS